MKTYNDIEPRDLKNMYYVVINGNKIAFINENKKPCIRKCLAYAKKGNYTELWYMHENEKSNLIEYWN